jgi:hypothetical protein
MLSDINYKYLKMFIGDYTNLKFSGVLNYYIVCSGVNSGSPNISLKIIMDIENFREIYKMHLDDIISRSDEDGSTVYKLSTNSSYVTRLKRHSYYGEMTISIPLDLFNLDEVYSIVIAKYGFKTVEFIKQTFLTEDCIECFSTSEQEGYYSFASNAVIEPQNVINALTNINLKLSDRVIEDTATILVFRDILGSLIKFTISEDSILITFQIQ